MHCHNFLYFLSPFSLFPFLLEPTLLRFLSQHSTETALVKDINDFFSQWPSLLASGQVSALILLNHSTGFYPIELFSLVTLNLRDLQSHIYNYLLCVSTWIANKPFRYSTFKTRFLMISLKLLFSCSSTAQLNDLE